MTSNKYRFKKDGLSLLEFIIAGILISVIAAFLVNKYQEIRYHANILILKGMKLSLEGAEKVIYSESLLKGTENKALAVVSLNLVEPLGTLETNVTSKLFTVTTRYGYPIGSWAEIIKVVEFDQDKWRYSEQSTDGIKEVVLWTADSGGSVEQCNIRYQSAQKSGFLPKITMNTTGC